MAIKVKLRQKPISCNRLTLYLDFYPAVTNPKTGKQTRREFLKLYLFSEFKYEEQVVIDEKGRKQKHIVPFHNENNKPKAVKLTPFEKQHNDNVKRLAEQILLERQNQLNKPEIYNEFERVQLKAKQRGEQNSVDYFRKLAGRRSASNHSNWISALKYFEKYTGGTLKFADLDEAFCEGFKQYLLTTKSNKSEKAKLANNSAVSYFNKLKAMLKQAYRDGLIPMDLYARIKPIKTGETRRNFLTQEELNRLVKTECNNPLLKRAAIFSALTGLRFSDIQKLTWGEIEYIDGQGYYIRFTQKKTKGIEDLPISDKAASLMGERRQPNDKVFEGLVYSAYHNKHLFQWLGAAGITKDITFHSFRHTYATLQLAYGTDIYTVSKLLGHRDLKTTQVYAHMVDKLKREAADKIKLNI